MGEARGNHMQHLDGQGRPFVPMCPKEAAEYIGFSVRALAEWRKHGKGPEWRKRGRRIEYRKDKLDEWLEKPWTYSDMH